MSSPGVGPVDVFSNLADRLSYVLRAGDSPTALSPDVRLTAAAPQLRRMVQVLGVGRATKDPRRLLDRANSSTTSWRLPTEDLLTGLHAERVPVAFRLRSAGSGVCLELGTWSARPDTPPQVLDQRLRVLTSVLGGLYAGLDVRPSPAGGPISPDPSGGVCLGIPTSKPPMGSEFLAPVERVIDSVRGSGGTVLVLAHPVTPAQSERTRSNLLAEVRAIQLATRNETVPGPLAETYLELLTSGVKLLTEGAALGMWRTAVYLTSDDRYTQLAAAWQSVYASSDSLFEPLSVIR
jgi:hypothetical protein